MSKLSSIPTKNHLRPFPHHGKRKKKGGRLGRKEETLAEKLDPLGYEYLLGKNLVGTGIGNPILLPRRGKKKGTEGETTNSAR